MTKNNLIQTPISAGELCDKLTILEIKIKKIKNEEKLTNIRTEHSLLHDIFISYQLNSSKFLSLYKKLESINNELWNIEDNIRLLEKAKNFSHEFIDIARSVYINNDERATIKKEINILFGSKIIEEKSYEDYS